MLTALGEESDRVLGLETGADDYVTKPFSPRELTLRVQAVLRRARAGEQAAAAPQPVRSGRLEVDVAARRARSDGRELDLTVREFDLLAFFVSNPGRAFTRAELLEQVWGWSFGDLSTSPCTSGGCARRSSGTRRADAAADGVGRRLPLGGGPGDECPDADRLDSGGLRGGRGHRRATA